MNNTVLYSPQAQEKIKSIATKGKDLLHILADFDKTLTYARVNNKETPSIISVLYNEGYLSKEYSEKAKQLATTYRPIEDDLSIPLEKRKEKMLEWRTNHRELLIKSKLSRKHIQQVVDAGIISLRDGGQDFLETLNNSGIPIIIISASGLGKDSIELYLKKHKINHQNIHIISNGFVRDENENAVSYKEPIITSLNKDETVISQEEFPEIYPEIIKRKNVIVLGDQIGDIEMATGFDHEILLKIGFLNEPTPEKIEEYQKHFDVVLLENSPMDEINKIIKQILT